MNVLPCGLVVVTLQTFGGIDVGGQKDGMLAKVGSRRRSGKQRDESNQVRGDKTDAVSRVRKRHRLPFAESEDFAYPKERQRVNV